MYLKNLLFVFVLGVFSSVSVFAENTPLSTAVPFFSASLEMQYDPDMLDKNKHCTSTACIKRFYLKLESSGYQVLLDDLLAYKEKLGLNDWFFYNLIRKTVEHIYSEESEMFKTSTTWFFLTKAGFDTRLYTAKDKYTFIFVRTEDQVFGAPYVKMKGQQYVNLTGLYFDLNTKGVFFEVPRYQPGQLNHQAFSFEIGSIPDLPPMYVEKQYTFKIDKEEVSINVDVDTLGIALMSKFPVTDPINYINVPLSNATMMSLKSALAPHLEGKTDSEKLNVLVSFTRRAFPFKNDQVRLQGDYPMTADQLMMADTSDFEDRCAVMNSLLLEMTELNFILIKYLHDDIITVGVALPETIGKAFSYKGIDYTICDPTMPSNSSKLGIYPISLEKDIEVIKEVNRTMNNTAKK